MNGFEDLDNLEVNENKVYRVYGGDSTLEGGFITNERPVNPIQARESLGLSQHDFIDEDGNTHRNLADTYAECTIYTDNDNNIINNEGIVTDEKLYFSEVKPQSDMTGGGFEHQLEQPFEEVVQVDHIEELRHQPTEQWQEYVEDERNIIAEAGMPTDEIYNENGWETTDEIQSDQAAIDTSIENELYDIQKEDTDEIYNENGWETPDEVQSDQAAIDTSIENELYDIQKEDTDDIYNENGWETPDEVQSDQAAIDTSIENELYDIQKEDTDDIYNENGWETPDEV